MHHQPREELGFEGREAVPDERRERRLDAAKLVEAVKSAHVQGAAFLAAASKHAGVVSIRQAHNGNGGGDRRELVFRA